jgi:hypothetical protein
MRTNPNTVGDPDTKSVSRFTFFSRLGGLALEEPDMKFLLSTAAIAVMTLVPATASAQFAGLDNNTVFAGTVGAGLGGVVGSQLAGSNNRTEGAAIGALAGGLAGAAYGNSQSSYYGNPYAGQFNPGFNGRNLAGTARLVPTSQGQVNVKKVPQSVRF